MQKGVPHVTLSRLAWRSIATQAAGHSREAGGLLVGRQTQMGTYIIAADVALAHIESDDSHVRYDHDEVAKARAAAYSVYGPRLEPVGGWHVHPWAAVCVQALTPQISDDDIGEMLESDIELIVATFPRPSSAYKAKRDGYAITRIINNVVCKGEVYLKTGDKKVIPCTITVR